MLLTLVLKEDFQCSVIKNIFKNIYQGINKCLCWGRREITLSRVLGVCVVIALGCNSVNNGIAAPPLNSHLRESIFGAGGGALKTATNFS